MLHVPRRVTLLTSWVFLSFANSAQSALSIENQPEAVCSYLARAANDGSLAGIALGGHGANGPAFPVPQGLANGELAFKDQLDINNDGKREYVYVVQYSRRDRQSSPVIVAGSRFLGPFAIPRVGIVRQELFVYDESMHEMQIQNAEELGKALAEDADQYRFVPHANSYYVVAQRGEELRYAMKVDSSNIAQPICAFEQRSDGASTTTHAMTTYEWLEQSLEDSHTFEGTIWEYAFTRDDLAVAELLVANGRSVNEKIAGDSLLVWAIRKERDDLAEWLLERGADPNVAGEHGDTPLQRAVNDELIDVALNLMRHGADPAAAIFEISALGGGEHKRALVLAAIEHLDYIPEQFLSDALREDPGSLEGLVETGAAVRPYGVSWRAGERMKLPFHVDRYVQRKANNSQKAAIAQLFQHDTLMPKDNFAIASYGSYTQGVQIVRYGGSKVADEDFLYFATALCYYFMPFDCGAEALVNRAQAWVVTLTGECPASMRSILDEPACRLAAYLRNIGHERVNVFSVTENENDGRLVEWQEFLDTYRAKHGH